jgi:hypothetical protein
MRRLIAALAAAAVLAGPAAASEAEGKKPSPTVLMSPVALPVIVDGRLANYIYVTLRLNLAPKADSAKLREKEPFFRDALLRAAYRTPLQKADDPNSLDPVKFRAAVLRESAAVAGPGQVVGFQLLRAQPQRFLPKPKPAEPPKG